MLIATCDDESQYCDQVEKYAMQLGETLNIEIQCDKYTSGMDLLESDFHQYQFIFLDINIKDENGIDIAERIRETNQKVEIIFLTALLQYAVEGYKVKACRFLVKPIDYEEFLFQIKDLFIKLNDNEKNNLVLIREGQRYTIKIDDIMYIEVINHDLIYHCIKYDITVNGTMKKAENSLSGHYFARIHNAYIVNMRFIAEVRRHDIVLKNGIELPVTRRKKESFEQAYLEFWGDVLG